MIRRYRKTSFERRGASVRALAGSAVLAACLLALLLAVPTGFTEAGSTARRAGSGVTEVGETIRVLMPDGSVQVMYMDDYLKGVVPSEVGADWPYDALCAQAVAARCFAATADRHLSQGADVCTTTHCQVYKSARYQATDLAVDSTHKVAALYGDEIIQSYFFGHCDGHTRNSEDVWGGYLPYCRSVSCPCGNTTMYGHGVGMCQEGARTLAGSGWDYADILKHYYTGVEVRSTEPAAMEWHFAEGTTRPGFVTYLCLGNPGESEALVTVRYLLEEGENKDVSYAVPAHSRTTIDAAADIGTGRDFSSQVISTNGVGIVAERPMYFDYRGFTGGHDTVGSAHLRPTWYFAEGTTRADYDTYLCVGNPSETDAKVTVTFLFESGGTQAVSAAVPARSRKTIDVEAEIGAEKDFSCVVESTNGVGLVVERPMYFKYGGVWDGGHDALGSLSTRPSWYFAEGSTRAGFATYLCLSNPSGADSTVRVEYLVAGGGNVSAELIVPAMSRRTVNAQDGLGAGRDFATRVTSTNGVGVVAERPMYFNYGGALTGGSDTVGTSHPRATWSFAEGTTRPGFDTYLCLANPSEKGAQVRITYMKGDGTTAQQDVLVDAVSRTTVSAKDALGTGDDPSHDFGISVQVTNNVGIIVERPMYFDYAGWTGGHVAMGH
ncbi:MAG: SpoIID/LytB domain-containing protein [Actinobacteria bacterium]|nr:SpoIID/LytB domain-containing protein [Actinomycetota bacterium]